MKRLPQIPFLAVLSVVLLGCGGPEIEVGLSPGEAVLSRGGSARFFLTITSTRLDAAGDFTVEGAPPGVTARFVDSSGNDVGGGAGGTNPSELVLTAAKDARLGPATLTIVASHRGARLAEEALSIDVQGLTVTGTVEGERGFPLGGLTVRIRGLPETMTAADGTFTIHNAPSPYDLTVASIPTRDAHTWLGLTTTSVRVTPFLWTPSDNSRSVLSGSFSGLNSPHLDTDKVLLTTEGHYQEVKGSASLSGESDTFDLVGVWWARALRAPTTVHALQTRTMAGDTRYLGYGRQEIAFLDNEDAVVSVALRPVKTARMTGSIVPPPGFTISELFATVEFGQHGAISLPVSNSRSHSPTYDVPVIAGSTYAFGAAGTAAGGRLIFGRTSGHTTDTTPILELHPPVDLIAPADGIRVTASTEFVVSNPTGGALTFAFKSFGAEGVTQLVTTMTPRAQLQDLSEMGLPAPRGAYFWEVFSAPGMASVDAAASNGGIVGLYKSMAWFQSNPWMPIPRGTGSLGVSETRSFTLQ